MKKFLAIFFIILLIVGSTACTKSSKDATTITNDNQIESDNNNIRTINIATGSGYITEYEEGTYKPLIETSYPFFKLTNEDKNNFPNLEKSLQEITNTSRTSQQTFVDDIIDFASEYSTDNDDYSAAFWDHSVPYVRRADTLVTSIMIYSYSYSGGAHGYYSHTGYTYDTQTGNPLSVSDIVTDQSLLAPAIEHQLKRFYSDVNFETFESLEYSINEEAYGWTLDYNGITFYFPPYALASYAAGEQTVTLSFEEYPEIVKDKYKEVPSSYGVELNSGMPFYYDTDNDGILDKIIFNYNEYEYDNDSFVSVSVNDTETKTKQMVFDANACFMHTKNGKNMIYAETAGEGDYWDILTFDVAEKARETSSAFGMAKRFSDDNENNDSVYFREILTNPDSFYLQTRTEVLSTVSGCKEYYITESGDIETDDVLYKFTDNNILKFTLIEDVKADVYDENKNTVNGSIILKAGDDVLYYATDGEKFGFLKCDDGTICRVERTRDEDYNFYVNGIKIDDLFDGILFAS